MHKGGQIMNQKTESRRHQILKSALATAFTISILVCASAIGMGVGSIAMKRFIVVDNPLYGLILITSGIIAVATRILEKHIIEKDDDLMIWQIIIMFQAMAGSVIVFLIDVCLNCLTPYSGVVLLALTFSYCMVTIILIDELS